MEQIPYSHFFLLGIMNNILAFKIVNVFFVPESDKTQKGIESTGSPFVSPVETIIYFCN